MPTVTKAPPINVPLVNEMLVLGSGQASLTSEGLSHLTKTAPSCKSISKQLHLPDSLKSSKQGALGTPRRASPGGFSEALLPQLCLKEPWLSLRGHLGSSVTAGKGGEAPPCQGAPEPACR